jgi:hypothetical protein
MPKAKKKVTQVKDTDAVSSQANPRFDSLVEALALHSAFAAIVAEYRAQKEAGGRKFGSNGLKVNGRLFALGIQGTLVVKLPKDRVSALVASGQGEFFDPGHGRLMKEWIALKSQKLDWAALACEACNFVGKSSRK